MYKCEQCGCMTFDRVMLEDGLKVCEYCLTDHDSKILLAKAKKITHHREYNNLAWLIKKDNKTIKNWCKKHGLSQAVATAVINKCGHYAVSDIAEMSTAHLDVLIAAQKDGYEKTLIAEGYVEV